MKRLLCIWLPNWPIQRHRIERQAEGAPEKYQAAKHQAPIVLWKEDPRRGRLVVGCCRHAHALGVRVSMPIAQAGEMVQEKGQGVAGHTGSGQAVIGRHEPGLDQESLEQIAGLLQQHLSPLVATETLDDKPWAGYPRHQSESLFCDITGVTHLFGDETDLLETADKLLATMGLNGQMAIADSPGAAWALAHYCHLSLHKNSEAQSSRNERQFSENCFISPPGAAEQTLQPLPVEALRIWPNTIATLGRLGIERVDQLLRLPRSGLATRLGSDLVRRIEQALGEVDEPLEVYRAPAEHSATLGLEYPTSDQKILADRIERLAEKVRAGLATRQRGALRLACRLDLSAHPPLTLDIGLFAPTIDANHLSGLMINRLETMKLPSCVERLTVSVTLSGPLRSAQQSLFDANSSIDCMSGSAISRLVDSLSGRLGRGSVLGVTIEDDPLPEKAFNVLPLAGNSVSSGNTYLPTSIRLHKTATCSFRYSNFSDQYSRRKQSSGTSPRVDSYQPSCADPMRRPLSLLADPIPLAVAFESGSFCQSVSSPRLPCCIRINGVVHDVVCHWGPERIETGWWKGPSVGRDYYRIEIDQGRWWWIFRNLVSKTQAPNKELSRYRWMLHGRFA